MIGYPIDSHVTFNSQGVPTYDRAVSSEPLRKLIKSLFSDGVLPNPSTNMQVQAGEGMTVIVNPGFAICNGCMKLEEKARTLVVQASSTSLDRIDTVILRLNNNEDVRSLDFYVLQGTPATNPVRPSLTQNDTIWEIGLADIFIASNTSVITNQRITDTRYETARCGIISSISEFDTTTLYQQVQADLDEFKDVSEADFTAWTTLTKAAFDNWMNTEKSDFDAWFDTIKSQLSGDVAANLQAQIGSLPALETQDKSDLVSAINELTTKLSKVDTPDNLSVELTKKINKPASATNGQVLTYNGTSNEWEAQDSKGGSITEPTELEKGIIGGDEWVNGGSYTIGKSVVIDENKLYLLVGDGGSTTKPSTDSTHSIWEETSISKLNSSLIEKLKWKLVDTTIGTNAINLPQTYTEIVAKVSWQISRNVFYFPQIALEDTSLVYTVCCPSDNNGLISFDISKSNISMRKCCIDGTNNIVDQCSMTVYYR